jgi:D-glycero-D-manno-heptose 1,7-bisphosphate phosphatase
MLAWIGHATTTLEHFLFLDRDGVINVDRPDYVKSWAEFELYDDVPDAIRWLSERRVGVLVVSNQSGLARGLIPWASFWELHGRMVERLGSYGGTILACLYCPHHPEAGCTCRKPAPRMILSAASLYHIPLARSHMIGDRATDLLAARQAGCGAVLLERTPPSAGTALEHQGTVAPDVGFPSLMDAVTTLYPRPA